MHAAANCLPTCLVGCLLVSVFSSIVCLFVAVMAALRSPLAQSSAAVAEAALRASWILATDAANMTRFGECGGCEGACLACCLLLVACVAVSLGWVACMQHHGLLT